MSQGFRVERDSMGEVHVPAEALWGAQTQRAVENFPVSGWTMPRPFLRALGLIKRTAAEVNRELSLLEGDVAEAIQAAADEVAAGRHDAQFPLDVFQTGSGTSSNMNANEVIAALASRRLGRRVHPNDHVNMSQSSNDVIPTAIHVSACLEVEERLLPALERLRESIRRRSEELAGVVKTGRTHLMDAMPVTFGQQLSGWAQQVADAAERIEGARARLRRLPQGGTAVGTGINAPPEFAGRFAARLAGTTGQPFEPAPNFFAGLAAPDAPVELMAQLKTLAVALMKIGNDLRWMNSGPQAGLAEIRLPALQPGSSIMPGKVNPVIPEAVTMVCAQVIGADVTVTLAGQAGTFELNTMLPVIAWNLLTGIRLLANAAGLLAEKAIEGFQVNTEHVAELVDRNPILVTALNRVIGYEKGAAIAKKAFAQGRRVKEVAAEETDLTPADLDRLLDPLDLTRGGIRE